MSAIKPVPPHGTRRRYNHRSEPCRCHDCRMANAVYVADLRSHKSWRQLRLYS